MTARTTLQLMAAVLAVLVSCAIPVQAQLAPSPGEISAYTGLHAAAAAGDTALVHAAAGKPEVLDARDSHGRTPLHVAAYLGRQEVMRALARAGADVNALDSQRYDIVTIAAVADDLPTLLVALEIGCSPANITSPWDGTALIAAAHEGHEGVIHELIKAGAPLDHVNSLGWTAMIEVVVLGDGGKRHQLSARELVKAGADTTIADRAGKTPLQLAQERGYTEMVDIISKR